MCQLREHYLPGPIGYVCIRGVFMEPFTLALHPRPLQSLKQYFNIGNKT